MTVASRHNLISEMDFAATVDEMAIAFGWKIYGVLEQMVYARRLSKGFPDRIMVRRGRLLFIEYKSQTGRVMPDQTEWLEELGKCRAPEGYRVRGGVEVYLWRPSDLDAIEEVLK